MYIQVNDLIEFRWQCNDLCMTLHLLIDINNFARLVRMWIVWHGSNASTHQSMVAHSKTTPRHTDSFRSEKKFNIYRIFRDKVTWNDTFRSLFLFFWQLMLVFFSWFLLAIKRTIFTCSSRDSHHGYFYWAKPGNKFFTFYTINYALLLPTINKTWSNENTEHIQHMYNKKNSFLLWYDFQCTTLIIISNRNR